MKSRLSLLLCVVALATGCPKYRPKVDFDNPSSFIGKLNEHIKVEQAKYNCYRLGQGHSAKGCTGVEGSNPNGPANAKMIRNDLLEDALPFIDSAYIDFINDLQSGRDRANFVADLIDLGTSAAVGITNGERPLQILGVALTAFRGGRRSADLIFYKEQSTPVLISKMDGNRANVRTAILTKEAKPIEDYPIGAAIADIVDYYNAGTLVRAFTQLQQDTAAQTKAAEDTLIKLKRDAGIKAAPTADQIRISNENAGVLRGLRKAYTTANSNVREAQTKIDNANQAITTADAAITAADQRIGEATARIAAATTNAARATATAAKATAEADKTTAQATKSVSTGEKTTAEAAMTAAAGARDDAFKNLRGVYDAIAGDPKLGPILNSVPDADPNIQPQRKTALQGMLQRNKGRQPPNTNAERDTAVDEYSTILLEFAGIVTAKFPAEPELNARLQEIIKANK